MALPPDAAEQVRALKTLERATLAEQFRTALAARDSTRISALVRHFLARATA